MVGKDYVEVSEPTSDWKCTDAIAANAYVACESGDTGAIAATGAGANNYAKLAGAGYYVVGITYYTVDGDVATAIDPASYTYEYNNVLIFVNRA